MSDGGGGGLCTTCLWIDRYPSASLPLTPTTCCLRCTFMFLPVVMGFAPRASGWLREFMLTFMS